MRVLVIGAGSMGKRRVRDLRTLGVEVDVWDPIAEPGSPRNLHGPFDGMVISTPPMTHRMFEASGVRFTEADIEVDPHYHLPSCTPRFNPSIIRLRERIARGEIGTPVAYTLHLGQHLADWHPGADLATYYAARRATGACREMVPFELGWLTWLFGPVTKAKGLRGSLAGIADIDDVYQVVVEHKTSEVRVLGHLLIDVVSRPPFRTVTVVGTAGSIVQHIRYTEAVYLAEMRAFVASVERGAPWPFTLAEEAHCLDTLHTIERFS